MVQKGSYNFRNKVRYHYTLVHSTRDFLKGKDFSRLVGICFGGHELLEVKNVLLRVGFDPSNVYSIEYNKGIIEEAMETNERERLGIPETNFLRGYDWEIFERMFRGEEGVPDRKIDYLNLQKRMEILK